MKNNYLEFYNSSFGCGKYCTKSWGLASFEAGAQSRQAEINELVDMVKTSADSEMYLYDALQKANKERNELQKRIDNLTNTNESLVAYKNQLLNDIFAKGSEEHVQKIKNLHDDLAIANRDKNFMKKKLQDKNAVINWLVASNVFFILFLAAKCAGCV